MNSDGVLGGSEENQDAVLRIYDLWGQGPTVAAEVGARAHTHTTHTFSPLPFPPSTL